MIAAVLTAQRMKANGRNALLRTAQAGRRRRWKIKDKVECIVYDLHRTIERLLGIV